MLQQLFAAFLFFLPAGVANVTPPIINKIPLLNRWKTPLDLGSTLKGHRLLGPNKTWRGLVYGTLVAGLVAMGEYLVFSTTHITSTYIITFSFGAVMGFGALIGDAVES